MKKTAMVISSALLLTLMTTPVLAEHFPVNGQEWTVTFNGREMTDDFRKASYQDVIEDMQPGDDATFVINVKNNDKEDTYWYMTNTIINSFEDHSIARGGAYTYRLVYYPAGKSEIVLYDSNTVGGEDTTAGIGLHEATNALGDESQNNLANRDRKDYIYLDQLKSGQQGKLVLDVALDGETQGNAYQDTLADLRLNFAVEKKDGPPNTADPYSMIPWFIATGISGLVFLIAAIIRFRNEEEEA